MIEKRDRQDIFHITDIDSLSARSHKGGKLISLQDSALDTKLIPVDYAHQELFFPHTGYHDEIYRFTDHFLKASYRNGCPKQFGNALIESILNAHQHGNGKNPQTPVALDYKIQKDTIRLYVSDRGGNILEEFIPYILAQRTHNMQHENLNFYDFTHRAPNAENNNLGQGTSFIHRYADDVQYFKNEYDGLSIYLVKKWPIKSSSVSR